MATRKTDPSTMSAPPGAANDGGLTLDPVASVPSGHTRTKDQMSPASRSRELGAVFTRRWVAELVLDLAGYTSDKALHARTVLEPACGYGAFVDVIVERLLASCARDGINAKDARQAIVALDLDPKAVEVTRESVTEKLVGEGLTRPEARRLARTWIRQGDFLKTAHLLPTADWVVGNPPYVRIEEVSRDDMAVYRTAWTTMSGRADVYVGFFEAGLTKLTAEGRLAYICADRWMRNSYGANLRALVEERHAVEVSVVMHSVDAFEDRVAAYPAITVLANGTQRDALVVEAADAFDANAAARLVKTQQRGVAPVPVDPSFSASWLPTWPKGAASWPSGAPNKLRLLTTLEATFPTLAETGAKVAVGTATGADDIYVIDDPDLVEDGLAFPTLAARETTLGGIDWRGRYLITPWTADGLVDIEDYPKLSAYLNSHRERLQRRHVATRNPDRWWRTIDRVYPQTATRPKLLIPDLKDRIHPVLDQGTYLPLHSLYYLTSDQWDLSVLGGLLMSEMANMFVEAYSVRMANGYMRVSAQYLRRVRVPRPETISRPVSDELRAAFWSRDHVRATNAARIAYGLSDH